MGDLDMLEVIIDEGNSVLGPSSLTSGLFWFNLGAGRWGTTIDGIDDSHRRSITIILLGCCFYFCQSGLRWVLDDELS